MTLWMFVAMVGFFGLGVPIAWAMAAAATLYMTLVLGVPLEGMVQRVIAGADSFPLLAIPFFVLAGNLMNSGGITQRLVEFAKVLVGHIRGGLAHVVVVTNMVMAGMSGSASADAAGSGAVLIPAMEKAGYTTPFAAAIVASAATIGPVIPPSIPFVVYGSVANVSIGRLLLGGAVPGVVMGLCLMVFAYVIARRRNYPFATRATLRAIGSATLRALPPLGMPAIILGGIIGGVTTPTEAAVAGAMYAFVLGAFVYHELTLRSLYQILTESALTSAAIAIIIAASQPMGWVMAYEQAPMALIEYFNTLQLSAWQILLIINAILLIVGMFMEGLTIIVMAAPLLGPLVAQAGIDPVHFGVILILNIEIGSITPPVGMVLYTVMGLCKIKVMDFMKEAWPFMLALVVALILTTYIPTLSLWLPNAALGVR